MGKLTTHVLDTMNGCPAAGMSVTLLRRVDAQWGTQSGVQSGAQPGAQWQPIRQLTLNADGRADSPLLEGDGFTPGRYRMVFAVADYFRARGVQLPDPPFLDEVPLDFGIADASVHYHVPLLASPWAYSTYRGS